MNTDTEFDTFLSYNHDDRQGALELFEDLKQRAIRVWIDGDELKPGTQGYRKAIEKAVSRAPSAIIAIGPSGPGGWQEFEIDLCIQETRKRGLLLIPLLLPGGDIQQVPPLLRSHFAISDFSAGLENSREYDRLQWAIAGEKIELLAVEIQKAEPTVARERDQYLDLVAMTHLKAVLYQAAEAVAKLSESVISSADEEGGSDLTRWVAVITNLRWQRGYLKAFQSLFRVRRSGRFLRDFDPSLLCNDDPDIDGVLGTSSSGQGALLVTIDGEPAAKLIVSESDRTVVERGVSAYGRLGKPLSGVQSLLSRLAEVPIETVEHEESPLATLFYQNRRILASLAARHGMPGDDFLLRPSIHQGSHAPEPIAMMRRLGHGEIKQVVLAARRSLTTQSITEEARFRDYVKLLDKDPDALKAVHQIFGDTPEAIRQSWEMSQTFGRNG